jgi:hypothetical protein
VVSVRHAVTFPRPTATTSGATPCSCSAEASKDPIQESFLKPALTPVRWWCRQPLAPTLCWLHQILQRAEILPLYTAGKLTTLAHHHSTPRHPSSNRNHYRPLNRRQRQITTPNKMAITITTWTCYSNTWVKWLQGRLCNDLSKNKKSKEKPQRGLRGRKRKFNTSMGRWLPGPSKKNRYRLLPVKFKEIL